MREREPAFWAQAVDIQKSVLPAISFVILDTLPDLSVLHSPHIVGGKTHFADMIAKLTNY